ncbi:MAG: hypothetical protein MK183_04965 [Verrucomicrobiales bacterium]|nr:hypothetical protein [Verrucomicrobiales bacterium]
MRTGIFKGVAGFLLTTGLSGHAIEVDGSREAQYGQALAIQQVQTGFGDPGSELDAAYALIAEDRLFLMLTGNLEANFNKLAVFIDSVEGGQNRILGNENPNNDNWAEKFDGFTFDTGFAADYLLIVRHGFGGTKLDLDFAGIGAGNTGALVGSFNPSALGTSGPFAASLGINLGFNNSNSAGVGSSQGQAADSTAAANVLTGVELEIPLALIGNPGGDIRVCAMINGHGHDYLSNQFLGAMPTGTTNLGTDGWGNFIGGSSLGGIDLNNYAGDQFFIIPGPEGAPQVTGFSMDATSTSAFITWTSSPDIFYAIESSADLQLWEEIDDGILSQGQSTTYDFQLAAGLKKAFYRIVAR